MKLIKTDLEYNQALKRLEEIFDAPADSIAGQEAELLALLIENYEDEKYKIETPDPIVAINIRMEEMQLKQKDLVGVIGSKGVVSEVLNRKRRLTLTMIRKVAYKLKITPSVLIQDYPVK